MTGYITRCSYCKKENESLIKSIGYTKRDGTKVYHYRCRDCNNRFSKKRYDKCKVDVFNHYGGKCVCCGELELMFLTIDHINNNGHSHRFPGGKKISGVHLYSFIRASKYPADYQLLCMNCNFGKGMNGGVCPHVKTQKGVDS